MRILSKLWGGVGFGRGFGFGFYFYFVLQREATMGVDGGLIQVYLGDAFSYSLSYFSCYFMRLWGSRMIFHDIAP